MATLSACNKFLCVRDGDRVVLVYFKWFDGSQLGDLYNASARSTHFAYDRDADSRVGITVSKDTLVLEHGDDKLKMELSEADRVKVRKCIGEYFVSNA